MNTPKTILISKIPQHRFCSFAGSTPEIGGLVVLDQGVTFSDGQPRCIVYSQHVNGQYRHEAEVYERGRVIKSNSPF
jgi:hypothetical protein